MLRKEAIFVQITDCPDTASLLAFLDFLAFDSRGLATRPHDQFRRR